MKVLLILSVLCAQAYSECYVMSTNPSLPKPHIAHCKEISPDKSDFYRKYNNGKPLDFIRRFYWTDFKGELNQDMLKVLPKLSSFSLSESDFSTIPDGFFDACADELDLMEIKNNSVHIIEPNVFKHLKHLRYLDILNNKNLREFNLEWISHCDKLQGIGVPTDTFRNMNFNDVLGWFPKLHAISIRNEDKHLVHDKIREVEEQSRIKMYYVY